MAPAIGPGVGAGFARRRRDSGPPPPPTLFALSLSANTIPENSAPGVTVGALLNRTSGSTLALTNDAGGRFALSGSNIVTGLVATDFEAATSHSITVRETLAGATNTPRDTVLTVNVTDVVEGSGNATLSNARVSAGGEYILFDVTGGAWGGTITVNPALFGITCIVPSSDSAGASVNDVISRRVGFRASFSGGVLTVWLQQPIYDVATSVGVTVQANAITNGTDSNQSFINAAITNNSLRAVPLPVGRIVGVPQGRTNLLLRRDVIDGTFRVEAYGTHEGGLATVRFDVTDGSATVTRFATEETRSIFQDTAIIDDAQWDANRAGGAEGGIGVYSSGAITHTGFADGEITVTATFIPKIGGPAAQRVESWVMPCNSAGGYVERIRYVDDVLGSDANDGLTAATAFATLQAACLAAGSVNGGATSPKTVPIVRLVGGTSGSPRTYQMYNGTGTGNAIPSHTHTWLTIEPAEGHDSTTTRIANWATAAGLAPRIRRLKLRGITHDISNAGDSTGTSSSTIASSNGTIYPQASNPAQFAWERCIITHRLGKNGQLSEGNSGYIINITGMDDRTWIHFHSCQFTDMNQRGPFATANILGRNNIISQIAKDALKEPEVWVAGSLNENRVSPLQLPVSSIPGGQAPQAGDVITGLFSGYTATVASYVAVNATSGTVLLDAGFDSFGFKFDDALTHTLVTLSGVVGTFQVGEIVRNATDTTRATVFAVTATTLRVRVTIGSPFASGAVLTGLTSGATGSWVSNSTQQNIAVVRAGSEVFRMQANPPHPDGLQIQAFRPQELTLSGVVGTFQAGETVTAASPTRSMGSITVVSQGGGAAVLRGPEGVLNQWVSSPNSTVTGATSGATGTLVSARHINNDFNGLYYCLRFTSMDGQILFGENGNANVAIVNVLGLRINTATTFNSGLNIYNLLVHHVSLPNQNWRFGTMLNSGSDATDMRRAIYAIGYSLRYCAFASMATDLRAAGTPTSDDAGLPGVFLDGLHASNASAFSALGSPVVTVGDPLWVNGVAFDVDDDPLKRDYRPAAGSPLVNKVPSSGRVVKYDLLGRLRRNDGSGAAGALEAA
jgi:hypothetical protein